MFTRPAAKDVPTSAGDMGDCHSSAVTRESAVAHAGGVKVNAFPLHV